LLAIISEKGHFLSAANLHKNLYTITFSFQREREFIPKIPL
jgi:hypothetical protein